MDFDKKTIKVNGPLLRAGFASLLFCFSFLERFEFEAAEAQELVTFFLAVLGPVGAGLEEEASGFGSGTVLGFFTWGTGTSRSLLSENSLRTTHPEITYFK